MLQKEDDSLKVVIRKPSEKPLLLSHAKPSKFTIGRSINSSYTIDSNILSERHRLVCSKKGKNFLVVPPGVHCEIIKKEDKERIDLKTLIHLGIIDKQQGNYWIPFKPGTRAILKIGKVGLGLEYVASQKKMVLEGLPRTLRHSSWQRSDYYFAIIVVLCFLSTFSSIWKIYITEFPPKEMDQQLDERMAKLIMDLPVQTEELSKELLKEEEEEEEEEEETKEPEKKETKKVVKKPRKKKKSAALSRLEKNVNVGGVLESQELKKVFEGVGVLTTKRPKGTSKKGVSIGYRDSSNVDNLVAGISKQGADYKGGGKRSHTTLSNPFDVSGSGAGHHLRSFSEIDKVIRGYLSGIRYLYERFLRKDPLLQGRVSLKFVISPQGKVLNCKVVSTNIKNQEFINELMKRIRTWKFPQIEKKAGNVSVEYPFTFIPKR